MDTEHVEAAPAPAEPLLAEAEHAALAGWELSERPTLLPRRGREPVPGVEVTATSARYNRSETATGETRIDAMRALVAKVMGS